LPDQERLYAWLGGLRASDACGGLLVKLASSGLASQQRAKLEALRVRGSGVSGFSCMRACWGIEAIDALSCRHAPEGCRGRPALLVGAEG
jgi:hypothetical protein